MDQLLPITDLYINDCRLFAVVNAIYHQAIWHIYQHLDGGILLNLHPS
jgi:hypothetical protein